MPNAARSGGTLIRTYPDGKPYMNMSARYARSLSPPMGTTTGNTALTIAISRQGSKAVKPVTKEQITAEIRYQASIAPFRLMLEKGQISSEDYHVIDTILTEKYRPLFVKYISPK